MCVFVFVFGSDGSVTETGAAFDNIVITGELLPVAGDYRSRRDGDWDRADMWQRYNGSAWVNMSGDYPGRSAVAGKVTIMNGDVVNMNVTPAYSIGELVFEEGNTDTRLEFDGTNSLVVTGGTLLKGTSNGDERGIWLDAGTLTTASITTNFIDGNDNTNLYVRISTGILNVTNDITFDNTGARTYIQFTDAGIVNVGGTITGGMITSTNGGSNTAAPTSGTVNYNSASDQNIGEYTYYNLTISNGGDKTLAGNISVDNTLNLGGALLELTDYNLTVSDGGSISGTPGVTNMIVTEGTGALVKEGSVNTEFEMVYPVGTNSVYAPMEISSITCNGTGSIAIQTVASVAPGPPALNTTDLNRYWDVTETGLTITDGTISFTYDNSDAGAGGVQASYVPYWYNGGVWQEVVGGSNAGVNPLSSTGFTEITGVWTARESILPTTYYSYKSGDWNVASTWTHDPGGTTQTAVDVPGDEDIVIILKGRTVSMSADVTESDLSVSIKDGGILDMTTYQFTSGIAELAGQGTLKLASVNFPTVLTTNTFITAEGGTTEYNNASDFDLPAAQTEYNNLRINAAGVTATQLHNMTLNGDLNVKQGTYQINDNSANRRQLTINGDILVDNGASLTIGTGDTNDGDVNGGTAPFTDYYDMNSHRIVVYGDFTNNGTVKFTNQSYPQYDDFPSNGMATVYFMGASNNRLYCGGTTDFYNIILDKGIDQTFKLTVYSTAYDHFRIFGRNDYGGQNAGDNPDLRKALWLRTGTMELTGLTIIPSLTEANAGGAVNGDFYVPVNAALHLNGSEVIVLTTADDYREVNLAYNISATSNGDMGIRTSGGTQSFSIYGKLQVDDGYLSTRESGGIITWDNASGELIINGGTIDVKQYRSAGSEGGLAAFSQSAGTFLLRGRFQRTPTAYSSIANLKDFSTASLNTNRETGGLNGNLGTFNINEAENVFAMSGGIIRIYDVCGTGQNEAFQVFSDEKNNNVTGGTIEIVPTTGSGTDATVFYIETTSDLGNFTVNRASSSATVDLKTYELTVLNDLTITAGDFNANDLNITIGGDMTIESGTSYTPGTNTTTFNGTNNQLLTVNLATAESFNNLTLNNTSGNSLTLAGSQNTLEVSSILTIQKGELADNGKSINVYGNIYNADTHSGDGKIVLSGSSDQAINGTGSGVFGNIELNNTSASTAPVTLGAAITINGTLTFSQDKLFNISTFALTFGEDGSVANAGTNRFIQTAGNAGDGGVVKVYSAIAPSFTFPVGTISSSHPAAAEYTPAEISFSTNPTTFGNITVTPVGYEHPNVTNSGRSLTYFWRVKSSGFDLGSAVISHQYWYSENDIVEVGDVTEDAYVAAIYSNSNYSWTKYSSSEVIHADNYIGGATTAFETLDFIDGEFTAGDDGPTNPFGVPVVYYSRQTGLWNQTSTWSLTDHDTDDEPGTVPTASDIVIIGGNDSVYLATNLTTANTGVQNAATLKIEKGSALDIGFNPNCEFSTVLSHDNGNGNFRLTTSETSGSTYEFPGGDFSDFNVNLGTTELYTTNANPGTTYWLPNDVSSYGNLIISPIGGSNIIFGNTDLLIYGNLVTRGQDSRSWYCPNWRTQDYPTAPTTSVAKTITINGDFDLQGGALVWYNRNNTGAQDFVIGGDLIVDNEAGIQVHTEGNGNTQSITIGGSLINNGLTPIGGWNDPEGYRGCDFTDLPLEFNGSGTQYITNDDPADNTYTIIESLTVNIGSSQEDELIVDIAGTLNTPTDNWLTLENGTFKYLHNDDLTISEGSSFTIASTAGLYINSPGNNVYIANSNVDNNDVYLNGKLTIVDGDVFIGQPAAPNNNNDIEYSGGGASEIEVQGGSLFVNGQVRRNPSTTAGILTYTQSGGDVTINGRNALTENAKFEVLNAGSEFNMSAGTLSIVRGGGGGTYGDLYLRPESSTVTGGEIIFDPVGPQDYIFDANVPVWDVFVNGSAGNEAAVTLLVSPLTIQNDLTIESSSNLDANTNFDIAITINGDFENNGTYTHRNNTTTFDGGEQTVLGTGTSTFYNLVSKPVTSVTLSKDITVENDLTLTSGTLACGNYIVNLEGDVTNNANYTDNSTGIVLNGDELQYVGGSGTWGQLEIDNSAGARLTTEITLANDLLITNGVFDINSKLLTLGLNSDIVGSGYSSSKMIASDGVYSNVGISKVFSSAYDGTTYLFPLGTANKYTPAELTITSLGNTGSIRVNNINSNHPGVIDASNVLDYYWELESNGITNFNGSIELNYIDADVQVTGSNTEADYIAANLLLPGTSWSKAASGSGTDNVDEASDIITFNFSAVNSLSGEYTAGIDEALPNQVPEFTSNQNGNWSDPTIWTQTSGDAYTLTGAPNGFIIVVEPEHTVTINADRSSAYRITLDGVLEVDNTTFGHNLGTVSGSGKLYLESALFPAGRYTTFFDCANTAILEYGGTAEDYTLVADLFTSVPNLHFTGTGTRALPNEDLTICSQLMIDGPTVDNSVNNSKLTILGTMERYNTGAFISGTGSDATVTFAGTSAQTIGGALGDFTGANAFNNLEIDNSNGLTINQNGDIEIEGSLLLTDGNITTTSTNQLTITNTSSFCVTPAGGQSNSYVDGPLSKLINQGDSFKFPVGKGNEVGNKVTLSINQSGTNEWTVEYFTPNDTYTSYNTPLSYVNSYDRWSISAAPGKQAKVGIAWDSNSDLTPANTQNGNSDMRVAKYDDGNAVWNELSSSAMGTNSAGTVTTSSRITIPAEGYSLFSTACINVIKPRAKLTPAGPVCGTNGIPVSFSSSPTLNYVLNYKLDGTLQDPITVTSTPYTLPTQASGGVYQLVSFTYDGGKTGVVDQTEISTYEQPDVPVVGDDQSICGGTQASISGSAPSVGSVLWTITDGTGGSIVAPTSQNTTFNGTNGSGYTLTYTVDNNGCTASDELEIDFPVLAAQPDPFTTSSTDVCQTESDVVYTVPNDATVSYTWLFDNNGNTADGNDNLVISGSGNSITADFNAVTADGTLQVIASNGCGDSDPRTVSIDIHAMPVVNLTDDDADNAICNGSTIEFTASETSGLITVSTYDFYVDGISVQNGVSNIYSTDMLTNGAEVEVIVTSDANCATTSTTTTISVGNRIWTGDVSSDWNHNGNWTCGNAPSSSDEIIVPGSATTMPQILSSAECGGLTIDAGATVTLNGTNNFDIYGNWNNFGSFVANSGIVNIKGNTTLSGSSDITFYDLVIDNGITVTSSSNNVNVTGDLTNNGAFTHNNGTVTLNGSSVQTISGDFTGTNTLNNVVVDNAAGLIIASGSKQIDGELTLTNGVVQSNGLLTLGQDATTNITAASGLVTSYVDGALSKIILGNSPSGFFFPIGNGSAYKPAGVSALANAPGTNTWTAEYSSTPPAENLIRTGDEILRVSNQESWTINSSGGDARVTISWVDSYNGDMYVDSDQLGSLRIAHLNNSSEWETTNAGSSTGAGGSFGTVTSGDVITFDGAKAGSEVFTLGSTSDQYHPLPVELISFTGVSEDGKVILNWTTATEINNDYFEVQHSTDASNFYTIGTVSGNGTTTEMSNYVFTHNTPENGVNYYRLKQVDYDGRSELHHTIAVHSESLSLLGENSFSLYPNPYKQGDLTIEFTNVEPNSNVTISIVTIAGDIIYQNDLTVPYNKKYTELSQDVNLSSGIYLIHIKKSEQIAIKRLIVY
jgi:hypothetical protein